MDIVYILGKGTTWENNEIRYSLRSMTKFLQGFDKVFIVGECPPFLKNVIHIPAEDKHIKNADGNIYEKILLAANDESVSPYFACLSDDYFLLLDYQINYLPYYYSCDLKESLQRVSKENYYKVHLQNTFKVLNERHLSTLNFNVHFPITYHKELFISVMQEYDWTINKGYLAKSIYANTLKMPGELLADNKIHTPKTKTAIYRRLKKKPFFSINNHSLNAEMKEVLQELYPTPSPFELI